MADTIQVLEGLFATPVMVEDSGRGAMRGFGALPTTVSMMAQPVAPPMKPLAVVTIIGIIWWMTRGR
jgi:hypothetical protein